MKVLVIGLGYVGLPLAFQAIRKGFDVIGVDKNEKLLDDIRQKKLVTDDPKLNEALDKYDINVAKDVEPADVFIICVPTPILKNYQPELKYVKEAAQEVSTVLDEQNLVVVESTINPGVCEEIVQPILDNTNKKYFLAHCPERINPGDMKWHVGNIPRVLGGVDTESGETALKLYSALLDADITLLKGIKEAEATKILENTFRDINIAFVNEMAQSFHYLGIDFKEVIKGAATKPFAFLPHYPGIGVGGHCIAVDPYYMIEKGREVGFDHEFLRLARRINSAMPSFAVELAKNELNKIAYCVKGTRIVILGIAYKANVADDRESPAYQVIDELHKLEADLVVYDPYFKNKSTVDSLEKAAEESICAILVTAHDEFIQFQSYFKKCKIIIDGRNCLNREELEKNGVRYIGIGVPS